jgi:hypothetical protein
MPREAIRFLRANPQALILLVICVVLGLGTLVAVALSMSSSGVSGGSYDDGSAIFGLHALVPR